MKSQIARIAALRVRASYRTEKFKLLAELAAVRQRGEDQKQFLDAREAQALKDELLGRHLA